MEHNLVSHDLTNLSQTIHTTFFESIDHFFSQLSFWNDFTIDCFHGFLEELIVFADELTVDFAELEELADLVIVAFEATAILGLQGDESFLEAIIDVLLLKSRLKPEHP